MLVARDPITDPLTEAETRLLHQQCAETWALIEKSPNWGRDYDAYVEHHYLRCVHGYLQQNDSKRLREFIVGYLETTPRQKHNNKIRQLCAIWHAFRSESRWQWIDRPRRYIQVAYYREYERLLRDAEMQDAGRSRKRIAPSPLQLTEEEWAARVDPKALKPDELHERGEQVQEIVRKYSLSPVQERLLKHVASGIPPAEATRRVGARSGTWQSLQRRMLRKIERNRH